MPPKRRPHFGITRKRRTRQHVIADLSVNHVERLVLRCGCSIERPRADYGLDLTLFTYNRRGEIENGVVYFQLKATDRPRYRRGGRTLTLRVTNADLSYWLAEKQPVILITYDAQKDCAHWVYVQAYFESLPGFRLSRRAGTTTVQMPVDNRLNEAAIRRFIRYRDEVEAQQHGQVVHHA